MHTNYIKWIGLLILYVVVVIKFGIKLTALEGVMIGISLMLVSGERG